MTKSVTTCAAAAGFFGLASALAAPAYAQAPAAPAPAAPAAPATVTLNAPGMNGPLSFPNPPYAVDVGPLGKWYVDAAITGLGYVQSNSVNAVGDRDATADLSNGQVFIQKIDGWWQFYAQVGAYSFPVLGTPYLPNDTSHALNNYFGAVPQAFIKLVPFDNFSIIAGKLPTLIGAEYSWTFENFNIERGLLWNQEPAVSRGVQATYTTGPFTFNLSLTDGYYSNRYNWLTGSAVWAINSTNTLVFAAGGNMGHTNSTQFATPTPQNNSSIYNLIYTYNNAPWIITPYLQYQDVPKNLDVGIAKGASSYAGGLLVSYAIDSNWSIGARGEYLGTDGSATDGSPNISFYGPGSDAWSLTLTPTYQYNRYFVRAEASVVGLSSITPGSGFGKNGTDTTQFRGLLETGILF